MEGDQKGLKKYEVNVVMKDGVGLINVPDEVKDASPLWDEFVMGKFWTWHHMLPKSMQL